MRTVLGKIKNVFVNIGVLILGLFIRRDKRVWLFGAWMGQTFSDNSRYLYQYMAEHMEEYGIRHLIWVTENEELLAELRQMGYEAYLTNSKEGRKWHYKAGVHVVCNMPAQTDVKHGDISGELSAGAVKLQLWHAVSVKAVGNMRVQVSDKSLKTRLKKIGLFRAIFGNSLLSQGMWKKAYALATSEENKRVLTDDVDYRKDKIIIAGYPRLCPEPGLLEKEKKVLNDFTELRKEYKLVLYCPTFREKKQTESGYMNPTEDASFRQRLHDEKIVWIEKHHAAASFELHHYQSKNFYYLSADFDINLVYDYIDLLITDYSSTASDCTFKGIPSISFVPDFEEYVKEERGFNGNYDDYYPGDKTYTLGELTESMLRHLREPVGEAEKLRMERSKALLYEDHPARMDCIIEEIRKVTGVPLITGKRK